MAPEKNASELPGIEGTVAADIIIELLETLKVTRARNAELEAENTTLNELVGILGARIISKREGA